MDKYVFFDIDGTLNETERTFEGIPEALAELKERGYKCDLFQYISGTY